MRNAYEINPAACTILTKKHIPNYYRDPKLSVNSGLPAGRTYTMKEYMEFKERRASNQKEVL